MTELEFINKLKKLITTSEQITIFNNDNCIDKIMEESIRYLRFKGFKVTPPQIFKDKIINIDGLIRHFYSLLNNRDSVRYTTSYNESKDRATAKRFVVNRMMATGASKEYALNECGEIISTVFKNEKEFKFKYTINFSIFGQNNLKWVTDKAIQLMNEGLLERGEERAEILREKVIAAQDTDDLGFNDIDDLLAKMEEG
jgi:hypothetical protein